MIMPIMIIMLFRLLFNLEKAPEIVHELVENEVGKKLILDLAGELIQHFFFVIIINGLQFVLHPTEAEIGFQSLFYVFIYIFAFVEFFHQAEKFGEVVAVVDIAIHYFVRLDHVNKIAHNIRKNHHSAHHYNCTKNSFDVVLRMKIAKPNS